MNNDLERLWKSGRYLIESTALYTPGPKKKTPKLVRIVSLRAEI